MTEESKDQFGSIDWDQMEKLANDGPDGVAPAHAMRQVFTEEMINKRVLWDISPHEEMEKISAYLDLPPASAEGMDKEHDAAHDRTDALFMVQQPIEILTKAAARAVAANMVVMTNSEDEVALDGPEFTNQKERLEIIIYNSTLAIIGELVDWNLLHTPHIIPVSLDELEEEIRKQQEGEEKGSE